MACAIALGVWAYTDQKHRYSGGVFEGLHDSALFLLSTAILTVVTGIAVCRWWALLALLGPLFALGYLQVSGYISPWDDGTAPLLSPPGISRFVWFGLLLLAGMGLRHLWDLGRLSLRNLRAARQNGS
jgi:hypothetical protein